LLIITNHCLLFTVKEKFTMADEQNTGPTIPPDYTQLTQVRVPLDEAADAFATRDASGRIPIVVIPQQLNRVRNGLVVVGVLVLLGGILAGYFSANGAALLGLAIPVSIILILLGVYRSFMVRIPEGVNGLLARGGRYTRTISSGSHFIPPWITVMQLVTRREIPFDVPAVEVPTQDNVRVNVDTMVTFSITDPYKFVYSISADDFDQVFQAACQDGLRTTVRQITLDQINDLKRQSLADFRTSLGLDVEPYGVTVIKINLTYAQPPAEFMRSQELRQLAVLQQAEQKEKQALALRLQIDQADLAHKNVVAQVEREREILQILTQKAEAQRRVAELEAEAEETRLARLEERLQKYPLAAQWDAESLRLEIARALAGNSRAVLQLGSASDIARAFIVRDTLQAVLPSLTDPAAPAEPPALAPAPPPAAAESTASP
jgi:regulator of protease activity HflC (stomatin/prohibitin superfamily)